MSELLLVSNPKRRRKKRKLHGAAAASHAKKHRRRKHRKSAASAAAPRRRRRRSRKIARQRKRPARARSAAGYVVGSAPVRRRKLNPHRRRSRHRRRNPSLRSITSQVLPTVKAGAWGAAGALGLDVLWGLVVNQLPSVAAYLTNPYVGFAAKAVGAVAVGAVGGHVAKGKGRELAVGAMTVVTHDFLKTMLQQMAPTIFGAGGSLPLGAYLNDGGLGSYLSGAAPIVGTASIPQAYLPFAGSSGSGAEGVYNEDRYGLDNWASDNG